MVRKEQPPKRIRPSKAPAAAVAPVASTLRKARPESATAPMRLRAPVPPSYEEIARSAYALYEARGHADGSDVADWLRAERELIAR